ncbi:MAG: hypothetical protein WBK51_15375 [Polaromonas sp.]
MECFLSLNIAARFIKIGQPNAEDAKDARDAKGVNNFKSFFLAVLSAKPLRPLRSAVRFIYLAEQFPIN